MGIHPVLPQSLRGTPIREATKKRAELIRLIAGPLSKRAATVLSTIGGSDERMRHLALWNLLARDDEMSLATAQKLHDVVGQSDALAISLRLYAGCRWAAGLITAPAANSHDPAARALAIEQMDGIAQRDAIFKAGVETALFYKRHILQEPIHVEGIPASSALLADMDN